MKTLANPLVPALLLATATLLQGQAVTPPTPTPPANSSSSAAPGTTVRIGGLTVTAWQNATASK